jgi:predicted transglutaminase-like cysteine proteinase
MLLTSCILLGCAPGYAGETFQRSQQYIASTRHGHDGTALRRIEHWQAIIRSSGKLPVAEKLRIANDFFNNMHFVSDAVQWGQEDYWATPLETLIANGGDCEDFAIAKYFTLREMGVPQDNLRLTYVKALDLNQAHMVLTYFGTPDSDPLVLDNLDKDIKPASSRHDLLPVYSFNGEGLWLARNRGKEQHVGSASRLSMWNSVVARISHEQLAAR